MGLLGRCGCLGWVELLGAGLAVVAVNAEVLIWKLAWVDILTIRGGVGNQGHLVDVAQRVAKVRYGIKSDGKIKVESKDEMKKRGLPSPDVVDAFVLTFAEVGRGRQKVRRTRQASWRVT